MSPVARRDPRRRCRRAAGPSGSRCTGSSARASSARQSRTACGQVAGSGASHADGEEDPQALELGTRGTRAATAWRRRPTAGRRSRARRLAAGAEAVELAELRRQQCAGRPPRRRPRTSVWIDPSGSNASTRRPPRAIGRAGGRLGAAVPADHESRGAAPRHGARAAAWTCRCRPRHSRRGPRRGVGRRSSSARASGLLVDAAEPIALVATDGGQAGDVCGVGRRRRRHPRQRRLVVGEDRRLEPAQLGTGLDPDVLAQQAAGVVDRPQRLHRPTGAVERQAPAGPAAAPGTAGGRSPKPARPAAGRARRARGARRSAPRPPRPAAPRIGP